MSIEQVSTPNHHARYPGFAGLTGYLAAATMLIGRQGDIRVAEHLSGVTSGDTVVDVGCGPGTAVRRAAKLGASAIGVDPAPVMLRVACLLTRPSDTVRFVGGSAEALPLPDASASVVWSIASVHHWVDLDAGLREARRVLMPGGQLVAIERRTRAGARGLASHGWSDQQARAFADHCRAHGFVDVRLDWHHRGRRQTVSVVVTAPPL
jgi:ubiquinone/menaquinone biosynthesis C-methylase UbiE